MSSGKKESEGAEGGEDKQECKSIKDVGIPESQTVKDGGKPDEPTAEGGDNPKSKEEEEEAAAGRQTLFDAFAISLGLRDEPVIESLLDTVDFNGVIKYIKDKKATNIITMAGAGISTSAGIPDFRSPGTGLYDNLQKYNLPDPTAVFSLDYFKENPEPFCMLSRELWPGIFKPTLCHYFIRLLDEKGILLRHYTQNIDTLESVAGLDPDKCVEAHGHFRTGHCLKCNEEYTQDWMKERIMDKIIPKCTEKDCEGLVKPDIVFFGEALPQRFSQLVPQDFKKCDLLIILGTSLVVQPFASLANRTSQQVPRLYINLENSCPPKLDPIMAMIFGNGFDFDGEKNYRDIFWQGTCDAGCEALADGLGWGDELRALVKTEHARIETEANLISKTTTQASESATKDSSKKQISPEKKTPSKPSNTPSKTTDLTKNSKTTPTKTPSSEKKKSGL